MNEDWSKAEIELIVKDYFNMLELELEKEKYNKTAHRKLLLPRLNNRSSGSVEFKHQNISSVLAKMGLPFIKGYKPRSNYQQILEEFVSSFLNSNSINFENHFESFANNYPKTLQIEQLDFENIVDDEDLPLSQVEETEPTYTPIKTNYLEKEQNNRNLGEQGEKLVLAYEQWRLIKAGKEKLAEKIEWVSKEKGDGAGYDILSKNINGTDRYVEVKTTKLIKETPIYLTRTEMSFAALKKEDFYLYRVFNFDSTPQIFIRNGQYQNYCNLIPQTFKGYF